MAVGKKAHAGKARGPREWRAAGASMRYDEAVQVLNQTSFLLLAAVVLVAAGASAWQLGAWRGSLLTVAGASVVLLALFLTLRSGANEASSLSEVLDLAQGGMPVVVEVYSDF